MWRKLKFVKQRGPMPRKRDDDGRLVYQSEYVWEHAHGRKIPRNHIVHHLNGKSNDNRVSNLKLMTASEHTKLHNQDEYYLKWRKKKKR